MSLTTRRASVLALATSLTLAGCTLPQRNATVNAEVLHNTLLCGTDMTRPTLQWLTDAEALTARYRRFRQHAAPVVDFRHSAALLIAMGPQPSSGYRLNYLPDRPPQRRDATLQLTLAWREPPSDAAEEVAVPTNPCLLLLLPRAAAATAVQVVDQSGAVRLQLAPPPAGS